MPHRPGSRRTWAVRTFLHLPVDWNVKRAPLGNAKLVARRSRPRQFTTVCRSLVLGGGVLRRYAPAGSVRSGRSGDVDPSSDGRSRRRRDGLPVGHRGGYGIRGASSRCPPISPMPRPGVRAQAITESRCTSKNAHRSTITSITHSFQFDNTIAGPDGRLVRRD